MKNGRKLVMWTALAAAAVYAMTGVVYLMWGNDRSFGPIAIWWSTLWFIGACAVAACGVGQERAVGGGRVFALSLLAFLVGAALAAEAIGLSIAAGSYSGDSVPPVVHQLGFALSWPVFLLALVEAVFALGAMRSDR
jgi:hypothetical protein